jgi:hypothetical protein
MTFSPQASLVAAVLSDAVYQDEAILPPPGWVNITNAVVSDGSNVPGYNANGYYGQIWAQVTFSPLWLQFEVESESLVISGAVDLPYLNGHCLALEAA